MATTPHEYSAKVEKPLSRQEPRVTRSPSTPFSLIWKPFQLQPCAFFPVFPGESLTSMMVQAQVWADPLKAVLKNTPWTLEYFSFYTKFRDLPGYGTGETGLGTELVAMIESEETLASFVDADGEAWTYCPPGGVDFLKAAIERIVETYFREDGEDYGGAGGTQWLVDGVPLVKAFGRGRRDVMDKLTLTNALEDRTVAVPATIGSAWLNAWQELAAQRDGEANEMPLLDYEDVVRASGGKVVVRHEDREDLHEPELLAYAREFTYGVNTVEPSTGVPSVAAGWRIKKQLRKAYRFPEFGWITCLVCVRPKVLYKNQQGLFASMMQDRKDWFMPWADAESGERYMSIADNLGPLKAVMDAGNQGYNIDLHDLLTGGEQFVNYAPDSAKDAFVTLPEADTDRRYPTATDVMAVFSDTTNGRLRGNGVVDISLKTLPTIKGVGLPESLTLGTWT